MKIYFLFSSFWGKKEMNIQAQARGREKHFMIQLHVLSHSILSMVGLPDLTRNHGPCNLNHGRLGLVGIKSTGIAHGQGTGHSNIGACKALAPFIRVHAKTFHNGFDVGGWGMNAVEQVPVRGTKDHAKGMCVGWDGGRSKGRG